MPLTAIADALRDITIRIGLAVGIPSDTPFSFPLMLHGVIMVERSWLQPSLAPEGSIDLSSRYKEIRYHPVSLFTGSFTSMVIPEHAMLEGRYGLTDWDQCGSARTRWRN